MSTPATQEVLEEIVRLFATGEYSRGELSRKFDVSQSQVCRFITGKVTRVRTRSDDNNPENYIPKGWTKDYCPWPHLNGGHTRKECQVFRLDGHTKTPNLRCTFRMRENNMFREHGIEPSKPAEWHRVLLTCGHSAVYSVVTPILYCQRHQDWFNHA